MKKTLSLIALATFLGGCYSSPESPNSTARFASPEVNRSPFHLSMALSTDTLNVIPMDTSDDLTDDSHLRAAAELSLGYGFEFGWAAGGEGKYNLKYQFYGKGREEASSGDISHAVSIGYVSGDDSGVEAGNYIGNREYNKSHWKFDKNAIDIALISGYRMTPELLLYGSVFYQNGEIDGHYYIPDYSSCTRTCKTDPINSDGNNYGVSLALEYAFTRHLFGTLEVTRHHADWFNRTQSKSTANINIGYRF
ncbi:hypothetical protein [Pseudoalteromonas viridis]|uniref:Outer membrane protein beta-barrel domain-containing protein n=1 Tax=Pseudoalteromonas viridis TaxID=339617 RepID=A0ABX7V6R6_9GAMM|nr:hypothetical protein [Pseudoalteromonas viridis]QTL35462.1 hypothetical protein J5X90_18440 [Pseudoalteromonas viridis]